MDDGAIGQNKRAGGAQRVRRRLLLWLIPAALAMGLSGVTTGPAPTALHGPEDSSKPKIELGVSGIATTRARQKAVQEPAWQLPAPLSPSEPPALADRESMVQPTRWCCQSAFDACGPPPPAFMTSGFSANRGPATGRVRTA